MDTAKREFVQFMVDSGVLRFGGFTTKSGRNSPYFVNTGNYVMGSQLAALGGFYAAKIIESGVAFDALFGPAYKGIPLAATTAAALATRHGTDKPYFFNRKEAKDHGEGGSYVGYQAKGGERIIVIEDVITAGTTVHEFMPQLKAFADVSVAHMFISVDRCEIGQTAGKTAVQEVREHYGLEVHAIATVADIRDYLAETGNKTALADLERYMEQYCVLD